jgi:hypothetical protein
MVAIMVAFSKRVHAFIDRPRCCDAQRMAFGQKIETTERMEAVASLPKRLRIAERISAA